MTQYNVLTEPWITALNVRGESFNLGVLDVLSRAHELTAVTDPAPPIQFGIYRLLVTFVQQALRIVEYWNLEDMFDAGRFDVAALEGYVAEIGENRFDLFHPKHPFLQTQPMEGDDKAPKSVVELFYHLPTGTNVTHFHHTIASEHAVAPKIAARGLCSIAPFMTAGGAGYSPSINGTPPWYVLPKGKTLFETILLNINTKEISGVSESIPPAWASTDTMVPRAEMGVASVAQGFTWQPRQVRFLPNKGGRCTYSGVESPVLIRNMVWGPGHKFNQYDGWYDPNVAYTHDERRGKLPLRPRPQRQLWRDYDALFLAREIESAASKRSRPIVIDQLDDLKHDGIIPKDRIERIEVYGMRVDKAKVFEWYYDALSVDHGVMANPGALVQVEHALGLAERVATALFQALKKLHPREGKSNKGALENLIANAQTNFWSQMGVYFESIYLQSLADQAIDDEEGRHQLLAGWKNQLRTVGRACLEQAADGIGTDADSLVRQVEAGNVFVARIATLLASERQNDKKTG